MTARVCGPDPSARLEYRNPVTGGPVLATLGCLLEGLPAGARSRPARETAGSVVVVAQGSGTSVCGGQAFELHPDDVAAIPAWTWRQLAAGPEDLVLFRVTDRPIHDAFGLYRAEDADS
jgi:gentisate 1,2-dioxygenase